MFGNSIYVVLPIAHVIFYSQFAAFNTDLIGELGMVCRSEAESVFCTAPAAPAIVFQELP